MKHGWIIHKHLLDNNIIPKRVLSDLEVLSSDSPVVVRDINVANMRLSEPLPDSVDIWSSLGTIAFQRHANKLTDFFKRKEHYAFFTPELHQYSRYQYMVPRELMLNRNGILLPLSECFHRTANSLARLINSNHVHIRPDNGLKITEAQQLELTDNNWEQWLSYTQRHSGANPQSLFWLFPAQDIVAEYRMVIYHNKVISSTPYPHDFRDLSKTAKFVPKIAEEIAEEASRNINLSDPIYVIDVAKTSEGEYYVIELNCMATSGWYNLSSEPVAEALDNAIKEVITDLYL